MIYSMFAYHVSIALLVFQYTNFSTSEKCFKTLLQYFDFLLNFWCDHSCFFMPKLTLHIKHRQVEQHLMIGDKEKLQSAGSYKLL